MRVRPFVILLTALFVILSASSFAVAQKPADTTAPKEGVLKSADVGKLFPEKVFFKGQSATVQVRNSGGVRFSDGSLALAALVDASGYASAIREKYQAYLLTEVPLEIGGQTLKPGAYGFGFLEGNKFVVMDIGANDVLQAASTKDTDMKRPVPFQFVAGKTSGAYRLYKGRDYVEFHRAK